MARDARGEPVMSTADISSLVPNPRNPRRHSDDQLERLGAALKRDGQTKPLLARKANRMLIGGHGVMEAAKRIGWTQIKVLLWDVDQGTADRVMLADNRLSDLSDTDSDRVAELLREIDTVDWFGTGFSAEEAEKLFGGGGSDLELVELDTTKLDDEFWINVRGPLAEQAQVLQRIKQLLAEYPTVNVKLGTIASD